MASRSWRTHQMLGSRRVPSQGGLLVLLVGRELCKFNGTSSTVSQERSFVRTSQGKSSLIVPFTPKLLNTMRRSKNDLLQKKIHVQGHFLAYDFNRIRLLILKLGIQGSASSLAGEKFGNEVHVPLKIIRKDLVVVLLLNILLVGCVSSNGY